MNIYLQILSFLHYDMAQAVEILSRGRQEPTYITESICVDALTTQGAHGIQLSSATSIDNRALVVLVIISQTGTSNKQPDMSSGTIGT